MTQPAANCPNCGRQDRFSLVQQRANGMRILQEYPGPHGCGPEESRPGRRPPAGQLTHSDQYEGKYGNKAFVVVGRIIYEYDQGGWNEWHVMMNDGTSAWLSDAQSEYALSLSSKAQNLPAAAQVHVGQQFTWGDQRYTVSVITPAHYRASKANCRFSIGTRRTSPSSICARNLKICHP